MSSPVSFFPGFRAKPQSPALSAAGMEACCDHNGRFKPADVLIVLAHPDDETFLSGSAALLQRRGYSVQFLYLTDGEGGRDVSGRKLCGQTLAGTRRNEAYNALKALGIKRKPIFLGFPDGGVTGRAAEIRAVVQRVFKQVNPRMVLTFGPDGITSHPDHVSAGAIADQVAAQSRLQNDVYHMGLSPRTLQHFNQAFKDCPEDSWSRMQAMAKPPQVRVDIRSVMEEKLNAIRAHQTQFPCYDIESFRAFYAAYGFEQFSRG